MAEATDLYAAREAFYAGIMPLDQHEVLPSWPVAYLLSDSITLVANVCTRINIESSKEKIVAILLPLPSRTAALEQYLYTLSRSFSPRDLKVKVDTTKPGDENRGLGKIVKGKVQQPPQPAFKRLHLLYLVHSLLVHVKDRWNDGDSGWHGRVDSDYSPIWEQLRPIATNLARLAVCGCTGSATKTRDTVLHVVSTWKTKDIFSPAECDEIKHAVEDASAMSWDEMLEKLDAEIAETKKVKGNVSVGYDWNIPDRHSNVDDSNAPWHELPATNGLLMKHVRGYPMRAIAFPNGGYQCEDFPDRANESDRNSLRRLYKNVARANAKFTDPDEVHDIDAMGNIVWKDPDLPTRNHWGLTLGSTSRLKWTASDDRSKVGYGDLPPIRPAGVDSAVERAKALAADRARGGRGRGREIGYGRGSDERYARQGNGFDTGRGRDFSHGMEGGDRGNDRDHIFDGGGGRGYGYGMRGNDGSGERDYGHGGGRGGFRGNGRGGFRGRNRPEQRGGYRGRGRW